MNGEWWWIDRWRKSTAYTDMTAEEQGLYRNLLDEVWLRHDHIIPDDPRILAKVSGDPEAWRRCGEKVLRWMRRVEAGWTNDTAQEVIAKSKHLREVRASAGRKGLAVVDRASTGKFRSKGPGNDPDAGDRQTGKPTGNNADNATGNDTGKSDGQTGKPTGNTDGQTTASPSPSLKTKRRAATQTAARAKRVPLGFGLTAERCQFALNAGLPDEAAVQREFEKFRDHEFKDAYTDWAAAWRNWVRRAVDYLKNKRGQSRGQVPTDLTGYVC